MQNALKLWDAFGKQKQCVEVCCFSCLATCQLILYAIATGFYYCKGTPSSL